MGKPMFLSRYARLWWHRAMRSESILVDGVRVHTGADYVPRSLQTMLFKGKYEISERDFLKRALRPHHRVLDIGAGVGLSGLLAAKVIGIERVLSYEPNPVMRRVIEANFRLNSFPPPNLRMKAVTADGRDLTFFKDALVLGSSMFDYVPGRDSFTVESDAIGDVIEEHRPDVIAMDAEGAESELIPAANFEGVEYLIAEFHGRILGRERVDALFSILAEAGLNRLEVAGRTTSIALFGRTP